MKSLMLVLLASAVPHLTTALVPAPTPIPHARRDISANDDGWQLWSLDPSIDLPPSVFAKVDLKARSMTLMPRSNAVQIMAYQCSPLGRRSSPSSPSLNFSPVTDIHPSLSVLSISHGSLSRLGPKVQSSRADEFDLLPRWCSGMSSDAVSGQR
jgi:hypothetical protein